MCIVIVNQSFLRVCCIARGSHMSSVEAFVTRIKILIGRNCAWLLDCFAPKRLVYIGSKVNLAAKHSYLHSIMTCWFIFSSEVTLISRSALSFWLQLLHQGTYTPCIYCELDDTVYNVYS